MISDQNDNSRYAPSVDELINELVSMNSKLLFENSVMRLTIEKMSKAITDTQDSSSKQ